MAILPEWNSRPDSVEYSWAGASSPMPGLSWIASTKVLDFRLMREEVAATSAVLHSLVAHDHYARTDLSTIKYPWLGILDKQTIHDANGHARAPREIDKIWPKEVSLLA